MAKRRYSVRLWLSGQSPFLEGHLEQLLRSVSIKAGSVGPVTLLPILRDPTPLGGGSPIQKEYFSIQNNLVRRSYNALCAHSSKVIQKAIEKPTALHGVEVGCLAPLFNAPMPPPPPSGKSDKKGA